MRVYSLWVHSLYLFQSFLHKNYLFLFLSQYFPYLCPCFVPRPPSGGRMKRESGENPGQSRCCELHEECTNTTPLFAVGKWEGGAQGASQKTCKTKSKNYPFEESG